MDKLTTKQKKRLMAKISPYVVERIKELSVDYTYQEIYQKTGLEPSRISEIKTRNKYVNEKALIMLIGGGMLSTKRLIEKAQKGEKLNEKEERYLLQLAIHEDEKLKNEYSLLKLEGHDPATILKDFRLKIQE